MSELLDARAESQLDRLILMESMCATDMGKSFLKWLAIDLCGWGKSAQSSETAALQDLWILLRRYVPLGSLAEIEHSHLAKEHQGLRALLQETPITTETEVDEWTRL